MVTLIASDIHCGDFKSGHKDFINFLELQPDVKRLIIAGDLCDYWVAKTEDILTECSDLFRYINLRFKDQFYYLLGNHDIDLLKLKDVFPNIRERAIFLIGTKERKKVVVIHGHQIDPDFYVRTRAARIIDWFLNKFDNWANIDTRKMLVSLADQIQNDPYDKLLLAYEENVIKAFKDKYDFAVTGHTHLPGIKQLDGITYCNTGDWMQHRTALRFSPDRIELVEYSEGTVKRTDAIFLCDDAVKDTLLEKMSE